MKKLALTAFASLSVLALSACGKTDDPNAQASADTADMPAEETVSSAEANAQIAPDNGAAASEAADEEQAKTKSAAEAGADVAKDFEAAGEEKKAAQ